METGLGWLGVATGIIGCPAIFGLVGGYKRGSGERKIDWLCAGAAFVITIIFWAIGMQTRALLSLGEGLAFGWLIGGLTGTAVILLSARLISAAMKSSLREKRLATLFYGFAALFAVSLVFCLFTEDLVNSMMGVAIASIMVGILQLGLRDSSSPISLDTWALFSITLAAAVIFSARHFDDILFSLRWSMPILVALTALLADYAAIELSSLGSLRQKPGKSYCITVLISATLIAALAAVYSWKVFNTWQLLSVVAVGLGIAGIVVWLAASVHNLNSSRQAFAVCAILMVAFVASAFKLWAGLGVAMGLIAAWAVVLPVSRESEQNDNGLRRIGCMLQIMLCFAVSILLYRLFVTEYTSLGLKSTGLHTHYIFIAATVGAVLPFLYIQPASRPGRCSRFCWTFTFGISAAVSPLAIYILWQINAVLGLSFGVTMAIIFGAIVSQSQEHIPLKVGFFALGAQLIAIQFVKPLLDIDLSRAVRIWALVGLVVILTIYFALYGMRSEMSGRTEE